LTTEDMEEMEKIGIEARARDCPRRRAEKNRIQDRACVGLRNRAEKSGERRAGPRRKAEKSENPKRDNGRHGKERKI